MAKHSKKDLKNMAGRLLEAKAKGDDRYLQFVFNLMLRTGAPAEVIEQRILEYSKL